MEALVAGDAQAVARIIAWARRGPAAARVDEVAVSNAGDAPCDANGFERLPTA